MKMGQMLGYVDVGLPQALRDAFSALHTTARPLDAHRIARVLDEDLGDPGRALARVMEPHALAAGSIGQVHRSALPDGTPVAVKVLHPGLTTAITRDLAPFLFASRVSRDAHAMLEEIQARLLEECDYGPSTHAAWGVKDAARRRGIHDRSWDVVLVAPGDSRIAVIRALRELRELRGKDLRDLESIVDSVPETLTHSVPRGDAESLRKRPEGVGAHVVVRRARART